MIRELEFKILCHRHADEIYRYARSMLASRADAEDATQEVLLRLWRGLSGVPFLNAKGWLLRTTRNYCLDQIRRRANRAAPVFVPDEMLEQHPDEFATSPGTAIDAPVLEKRISEAMERLPERLRSVFVLYEINGLRYREIADLLEIPLNSVKVYLSRARKKLREHLTKDETWKSTCKI